MSLKKNLQSFLVLFQLSGTRVLQKKRKKSKIVSTATANLNTARGQVEGGGTQPAGIICGGYTTSPSNATEEFTGPAPATVTIDTD